MMVRIRQVSAKELIRVLERLGFKKLRQRGSHAIFEHANGRTVTVPIHPGEDLDRGLLLKIIRHDIQIGYDEFARLLR